jgi:hypothetical protein
VLDGGDAVQAIELAEHALASTEKAMGLVDDSDGHTGGILDRMQELHLQACKKAKPDQVELARRLFAREIETGYDVFHGAVINIRRGTGKEWHRRVQAARRGALANGQALGPKQNDSEKVRVKVSHLGDHDGAREDEWRRRGEAAVLKRDLSHAYDFLKLAELYRRADQPEVALEWAEKGLKAFPERTDSSLREFVADG